mmetsp:Transcript_30014/g.72064  ORF Transcript_30014/g.72064 Transcript_30014/m.72064 type:complete len:307 (-) Transcript_30014:36-956(-)
MKASWLCLFILQIHGDHHTIVGVPEYKEGQFESACQYRVLRAATDVAKVETDKVLAHLRRQSVKIGKAEGEKAAKVAAADATTRAYHTSRTLVGRKALEYCASVSNIQQLPLMCKTEGERLYSSLHTVGRLSQWETEASDAANVAASKKAAIAGYVSTSSATPDEVMSAATTSAQQLFAKQYPVYLAQWQAFEAQEMARIFENKKRFFENATSWMIATANHHVRKKIWGPVRRDGEERMLATAKNVSKAVALKTVSEHLAPRFAEAAAHVLPVAVRSASKETLGMWDPHWDGTAAKKSFLGLRGGA